MIECIICFTRVLTSSGSPLTYLYDQMQHLMCRSPVTTGVLAIGPVLLAGTVNNAAAVDTSEDSRLTHRLCVSRRYYSSSLVTQCTEAFG